LIAEGKYENLKIKMFELFYS